MPQTIDENIVRICKLCGEEFHPTARKQYCCGQPKIRICVICGKEFTTLCTTKKANRMTCSSKCQGQYVKRQREASSARTTKICEWCGEEFIPISPLQKYCNRTHYNTCKVCGKQFEVDVRRSEITQTCSNECRYKLALENRDLEAEQINVRKTLQEKYGVDNAALIPGSTEKAKATMLEKYGVESYTATDEYKEKVKQTCQAKYGTDHHLCSPKVIAKRKASCLAKYGSGNVFGSEYGKFRIRSEMQRRYGVVNPSQLREFKDKATRNSRTSKLEIRICQLLDNYNIQYVHHYFLKKGSCSHEFDFFLPEYKMLIDADGLYFHGYLDDPDGVRVLDYYDEIRLSLIPEDHTFHVLVEGTEDQQIKELVNLIESCKGDLSSYKSYLFEWCRSIEFPYPNYTKERMDRDLKHLVAYHLSEYKPKCRIGESIIKHYHHSIYHCSVNNLTSPYDGWYDDKKLMKVIRNRLIYKNDVEPSKILAGFNISKICPCVSIFNPILAKHLTETYLSSFETVFDPFSGFSGRLLGVVSTGKQYIGSDLNQRAVVESNQIITDFQLTASVVHQDIFDYPESEYECLLTCPPYGTKERYADETIFKSCDEWIDECLSRFKCKRYVFVVDKTEKYNKYVVGKITSTSHFADIEESIIVI